MGVPQQVDEAKLQTAKILDIGKPPMRDVPPDQLNFPRMLYRHPKEKFRTMKVIIAPGIREDKTIPNEHVTKIVNDQKEMDAAIKAGWLVKPYIPADPDEVPLEQ